MTTREDDIRETWKEYVEDHRESDKVNKSNCDDTRRRSNYGGEPASKAK